MSLQLSLLLESVWLWEHALKQKHSEDHQDGELQEKERQCSDDCLMHG